MHSTRFNFLIKYKENIIQMEAFKLKFSQSSYRGLVKNIALLNILPF